MDTQVERQVESQVFIPDLPASHAARRTWIHCMVVLVTVMALTIAVLVGLCVSMNICNLHPKPKPGQTNCSEKFNRTFKLELQTRTPNEDQYNVFTVPKEGIYFLHGQVELKDHKDGVRIYLETQCQDRTSLPLETKTTTCSEVIFAREFKLLKNYRVYLVFNEGKPNLDKTTFRVYEL